MTKPPLARLERVGLRAAGKHEAGEFTGLEIYLDRWTGEEVYVGRTGGARE